MAKQLRIVNLIPTYNEKENIAKLLVELQKLYKKTPKYKFLTLIVDDNSPDGTGKIVKKFQKQDRALYILTGPRKGLGRAMIRGFKYAIKNLMPDIIIPNEADFAYPIGKIPFVVKKIEEGHDFVVASRHVVNGLVEGWGLSRELNHYISNYICATLIAGTTQVKDHNGAFRGIRVKGVLDKINFDKFPTSGFSFFNYLTFRIISVTGRIYEFPVVYKFRLRGESKVSFNTKYIKRYFRDVVEYVIVCIKIRIERTFR